MTSTMSPSRRFVPRSGSTWRDPFGMYADLRDHDPVQHVENGDYWVLSRFADVFTAARDTTTFSSAQGLTFAYDDMTKAGLTEAAPMVMLDPPAHTAFRRLVARGFTPRQVATIEPEIRQFVTDRLERLRGQQEADIVAELFRPLPCMVVAHYLGVPEADRARFAGWTEAVVATNATGDALAPAEAVADLFAYFSELVERRRREPGHDTVSQLVTTGDDTTAVGLAQILGFAFTMIAGGNDTATGLLGGSAELLTARPDQRTSLADQPGQIPEAIEELLRLTSPVQGLARTTTRDVQIGGSTIPTGRKVLLLYASGNRDPRMFGADADELSVTRQPRQILAFSSGAHHCLGAAAARLQARVVLEEMLTRCPDFGVDAEQGTFAPGSFVRRYDTLPFSWDGLR